eukprot:IDg2835t1
MDLEMDMEVDILDKLNSRVWNEEIAEEIKGKTEERFQEYMYEDLSEVAYADFCGWTDKEFKRLDSNLQRDIRDHLQFHLLEGQAATTFRTQIQGKAETLDQALEKLKETFLSEEARRSNESLWDALSFNYVQKLHAKTNARETLLKLFSDIERLRNCTSHAVKTDATAVAYITRAKLFSAVSDVSCFQHVRSNPPEDYLRLRNALYDAATQADTGAVVVGHVDNSNTAKHTAGAMYTDRRFKGRSRPNRGSRGNKTKGSGNFRYAKGSRDCWVCGKTGCHSSNHPRFERRNRQAQFKTYLNESISSTEEESSESGEGEIQEDSSEEGCTMCTTLSQNQQYLAYCRYTGQIPDLQRTEARFNTSGGTIRSMGYAWVSIPFGKLKNMLTNNGSCKFLSEDYSAPKSPNRYIEYKEANGIPVYLWPPELNNEFRMNSFSTLYTIQELRRLHKRTGHPSVDRLVKVLQANPRTADLLADTRAMLEKNQQILQSMPNNRKTI